MSTLKKPLAITLVVALSILAPVGIVVWSAASSFAGKRPGHPSTEINEVWGSLKNGEMWFPVLRYSLTDPVQLIECRIRRMDLETGIVRDAEVAPAKVFLQPFWLGDDLYAYNQRTLYKCVDAKFVELALLPPRVPSYFFTRPFLHDGRITSIVNPSEGIYQLVHLVDGEWIDGRRVKLPLPPGTKASNTVDSASSRKDQRPVTGVVFADEDDLPEVENADRTGESAIPIEPSMIDDRRLFELRFGPEGAFYVEISWGELARQGRDSSWTKLTGDYWQGAHQFHHPFILADPTEPKAYLIEPEPYGAYLDVHRIEGNIVQPSQVHWSGSAPEYLGRWRRFSFGLLTAWLLHVILLTIAVQWLANRDASAPVKFGALQAMPAACWRRGLAMIVDLLLALSVLCLLVLTQLPGFGIQRQPITDDVLFDSLFKFDSSIAQIMESHFDVGQITRTVRDCLVDLNLSINSLFEPPLQQKPAYFLLIIAEILAISIIKLELEGRFGITMGKWMLSIRTVRSTLRPCGFARALTRNLFYFVDHPFLITPLPAVISMLLSDRQQRLGDRVADTLVVRAGTIRRCESKDNNRLRDLDNSA